MRMSEYPEIGTVIHRWLADHRTLTVRRVRLRFDACGGYVAIRHKDRVWYEHYFDERWQAEAQIIVWREQVNLHHMYAECGCKPFFGLDDA